MRWPFSRRSPQPNELPIDGPWSVLKGNYNGLPMFVRLNTGYINYGRIGGYEHQVGIAVPLHTPGPDGLPTSEEAIELDALEDAACKVLEAGQQSLFVATITTGNMREFVYYTRAPEEVKKQFHPLARSISTHSIQLMIKPDREWTTYAQLR